MLNLVLKKCLTLYVVHTPTSTSPNAYAGQDSSQRLHGNGAPTMRMGIAPACAQGGLPCNAQMEKRMAFVSMSLLMGESDFQVAATDSKECERICFIDCSCVAYAYAYASNDCFTWEAIPRLNHGAGVLVVYLRVAMQDLPTSQQRNTKRPQFKVHLGAAVAVTLSIFMLGLVIWKRRFANHRTRVMDELAVFTYKDLQAATKSFSYKLGEGGFGSVYKGTLPNSSAGIAVKQLKSHHQGEKQFRAEVSTLGTIHHVNLVRLKGFYANRTKRFLVYDYMPNGSLDKHLFASSELALPWRTRYRIMLGIARGLVYLHNECRYCIIHCDIKPENILLDADLNPKISDFGLAKLLGRDFSRVLTTMRGTRGYLAPEWVSGVAITSKADVYSYGMMLFEIISGKRNWSLRIGGGSDYFPLQVMQKLDREEGLGTLLDGKLDEDADDEELMRACKVAGWCIQDDENQRPSMAHVVRALEGVIDVGIPPLPRFLQCISEIMED